VGVGELLVGADVDEQRARAALLLDLARSQGHEFDALGEQRALVELDDRLEVRRLGTELGQRLLDELVLIGDRQGRVVRALVADCRGDLHVHPRAAAHRAAQMPGPDLDLAGQREQMLLEGAEDAARALGFLDGQVGPRDVADEQRVAGQHGPGLLAPTGVDEGERGVLGPVAGRVQDPHRQRAELELVAVVERLVLVGRAGLAVDVDGRPGGGGEATVARDMVGVVVGLEDVLDAHAHVAREFKVVVDLEARVDDGGHARLLVADQVGGAAQVVVSDLAEDHRCSSPLSQGHRSYLSI